MRHLCRFDPATHGRRPKHRAAVHIPLTLPVPGGV